MNKFCFVSVFVMYVVHSAMLYGSNNQSAIDVPRPIDWQQRDLVEQLASVPVEEFVSGWLSAFFAQRYLEADTDVERVLTQSEHWSQRFGVLWYEHANQENSAVEMHLYKCWNRRWAQWIAYCPDGFFRGAQISDSLVVNEQTGARYSIERVQNLGIVVLCYYEPRS